MSTLGSTVSTTSIATTADIAPKLTANQAANVPALATPTLVLLSDVITAVTTIRASHNDLLAKLKAAGIMVADA